MSSPRTDGSRATSPGRGEIPRGAVREAREALVNAINGQDTAAVAAVLGAEVRVVTVLNDTVRGQRRAADYLVSFGTDSQTPFVLEPGILDRCQDGSVAETNGSFVGPPTRGVPGLLTQGFAGISWDPDTQAIVARQINFAHSRSAARRGVPCRYEYYAVALQHRLTASIGLEVSPLRPSTTMRAIMRQMNATGLVYQPSSDAFGPARQAYPILQSGLGGMTAAVRYRVNPAVSGALRVGVRPFEKAEGMNNTERVYVSVQNRPVSVAAVTYVQRAVARVGIGPSVVLQNFHVYQDERYFRFFGGNSFLEVRPDSRETSRSVAPAFGMVLDAVLALPMSLAAVGEVRAGVGVFGKSTVPGTSGFPSIVADNIHPNIALVVGVGR